ncbi:MULTISPECIES: helix-turn-helix domain-containing protein [Chryseobacterium]|uniref:AraC family transcriptional regulator n=1 Tax=Chryseobacterium candidae TaxID=1978493 RepID=A0ABY2R7A6_9FLAO|nr:MULTISPECIES: AraC family transcriptional regulator [Chryseobacterium]PXW15220.1 AraC-like DNA-binding protein [Chryseobacterium sp. CBTAP 102]THV60473.1 AraC family transcriptional regulator [Chryseobacterium candidae]SIQ67060.1 AraC-type DNA-binding protein [Chryseobacterium sp. RU33C]
MTAKKNIIDSIERLKKELLDKYILLMITLFIIYVSIFYFYLYNKIVIIYLLSGICFLSYGYIIVRRRYSINSIVHTYLILAPLYNIYIILFFWKSSVASLCWLIPIPLGSNIFFQKKQTIIYTGYLLFLVIIIYIIAENFSFNFQQYSQSQIIVTDVLLFMSNILIVCLLVYYKDLIRKQEIKLELEESRLNSSSYKAKVRERQVINNDIDLDALENIFSRIDESMEKNLFFKDSKFNLSSLSAALHTNHHYISKAIRNKGYSNFNSYINNYRVNYIKKLLDEVDLQKTTLMYIYTESGFSNQSTFNRVFKQIEGITPSDYIQKKMNEIKK